MRLVAGLCLLVLAPGCTRDGSSREAMEKKLSGIQTGEERQIAPDTFMKMHRVQATQPLGDGWQLAASTEGGFSVELPLPFNDFRIRSEAADHVELRMHTVGAKTPGKLAWTATCVVRADGKRGLDGGAPASDEPHALGSPEKAWERALDFDDASCRLIVEAQGSDPLPPEADRARFFRSFKRSGKPRW